MLQLYLLILPQLNPTLHFIGRASLTYNSQEKKLKQKPCQYWITRHAAGTQQIIIRNLIGHRCAGNNRAQQQRCSHSNWPHAAQPRRSKFKIQSRTILHTSLATEAMSIGELLHELCLCELAGRFTLLISFGNYFNDKL